MFLRNPSKSNTGSNLCKKIIISSALTIGIVIPLNTIAKPLINSTFFEKSSYSNKSFITDAVELTGGSVVTIETQRYTKRRRFPKDSRILLDPYFDRFFGLQLPYENQPKIEQS